MAAEASKLQVGVFVIDATVIGVAGAIWLGASRFLENTSLLVTYFSESVQGLEPGAAVKYRGVPAGRVEKIDIAPDGDLIEVLMSIDVEFAESVREGEHTVADRLDMLQEHQERLNRRIEEMRRCQAVIQHKIDYYPGVLVERSPRPLEETS